MRPGWQVTQLSGESEQVAHEGLQRKHNKLELILAGDLHFEHIGVLDEEAMHA